MAPGRQLLAHQAALAIREHLANQTTITLNNRVVIIKEDSGDVIRPNECLVSSFCRDRLHRFYRARGITAHGRLHLLHRRAVRYVQRVRGDMGQNRPRSSPAQAILCSACGRMIGQQKHSYDTRGEEVVIFRCWPDPSSCWPKVGPLRRTKSIRAFVRDWSRSPPCDFPDFMEQEISDWVQAHRTCCRQQ